MINQTILLSNYLGDSFPQTEQLPKSELPSHSSLILSQSGAECNTGDPGYRGQVPGYQGTGHTYSSLIRGTWRRRGPVSSSAVCAVSGLKSHRILLFFCRYFAFCTFNCGRQIILLTTITRKITFTLLNLHILPKNIVYDL